MGATQARLRDAELQLATPKFRMVAGRRQLDPAVEACPGCARCFRPWLKKHYCRRCGGVVCDGCSVMRNYRARGELGFRVCRGCCARHPLPSRLPLELLRRVLEFAGPTAIHWAVQACRRLQLAVPLPFLWGQSWDTFFGEGAFIAKGANGAVYRTRLHPRVAAALPGPREETEALLATGRGYVAVKVVAKSTIFSFRKWHHLEREVTALAVCAHRHVAGLLGVFQTDDSVYIAMEYCPGGDLFDWLVARRAPSEAEVRHIARQLLLVLEHMHDGCGAVHRDIKPENILLARRCQGADPPTIKLADFGFARVFQDSAISPAEREARLSSRPQALAAPERIDVAQAKATPCGTLGFAPPEVMAAYTARRNQPAESPAAPLTPVDVMKKTDIFAAGVTISILLTGAEPFPCGSSAGHVDAVRRGVTFHGRHWAHVGANARELVRAMLAAEPDGRPTAFEALRLRWLRPGGAARGELARQRPAESPPPGGEAAGEAAGEAGAAREAEFRERLQGLRKGDDTVLLPGPDGSVALQPRATVGDDERGALLARAAQIDAGEIISAETDDFPLLVGSLGVPAAAAAAALASGQHSTSVELSGAAAGSQQALRCSLVGSVPSAIARLAVGGATPTLVPSSPHRGWESRPLSSVGARDDSPGADPRH